MGVAGLIVGGFVTMSDADQLQQIRLLAAAIASFPHEKAPGGRVPIPPPARVPWAEDLFALGVRVHPDLAVKELVCDGPSHLGNYGGDRLASITSRSPSDVLREMNPQLADRIDAVATEREKVELIAELRRQIPAQLRQLKDSISAAGSEDLQ